MEITDTSITENDLIEIKGPQNVDFRLKSNLHFLYQSTTSIYSRSGVANPAPAIGLL